MRPIGSLLFLFLISYPLHGQVAAAGWCVVTDQESNSDSSSIDQPPDDSFPPQPDEQPEQPNQLGCDIGIGFLLYRPSNPKYNRFALVAVIGSESLGPGIAYILNPNAKSEADHRPIMAIAFGVIAPYDGNGIGRDLQLALGMTLSLRQGAEE